MPKKQSKNFKYLNGEDYENEINSLPQLKKIHKFADDELQKFDSFALVALNHKDENSFEDDSGNLCHGTIIMKLGDKEEYEDNKDQMTKDIGSEVTSSDYSTANLGALITHLVDAHFDNKKEKIAFYQTLGFNTRYEDEKFNQQEILLAAEIEKRLDIIRELATTSYDVSEGIVLLNSIIKSLERWKTVTDDDKKVLEKSRKEFDKRKKNG